MARDGVHLGAQQAQQSPDDLLVGSDGPHGSLARRGQCAEPLTGCRLQMNRLEPTNANDLCKPCASFRSVFTGIALRAALTCRLSRQTPGKPS